MSAIFLKTISILRMVAGVSTLIVPRHVGPLFGLPLGPEASVFVRLFGARDFVIGAYLWKTVRDWDISQGSSRQDGDGGGNGDGVRDGLLAKSTTISARGGDVDAAAALKADGIPKSMGLEQTQAKTVLMSTVRHNDVATALWLGLVCDAIDVVSYAACLIEGNVTSMAGVELGGSAVVLTVAGLWQLNVLKKKKRTENYL